MDLAWPVDRDPDQEAVVLEERGPALIELRPVRLDGVDGTAAPVAGGDRQARPSGGRSRAPSASARPCHAISTTGEAECAAITCRMYDSSSSAAIGKRLPGYSIALGRMKQYEQSRLETASAGLASR